MGRGVGYLQVFSKSECSALSVGIHVVYLMLLFTCDLSVHIFIFVCIYAMHSKVKFQHDGLYPVTYMTRTGGGVSLHVMDLRRAVEGRFPSVEAPLNSGKEDALLLLPTLLFLSSNLLFHMIVKIKYIFVLSKVESLALHVR